MKISIITPTLNRGGVIGDTIRSVIGQSYQDWEHVVVDGGSVDDTSSVIDAFGARYQGRLVFSSGKDEGIFDACNKGISLSTGDVVGMLNSDDTFFDDKVLERVAAAFDADPELMCVYGDLIFVKRDDTSTVRRTWRGSQYRPGDFRRGWQPAHPTFYARRECFERLGMYRLEFDAASDFELMMRFIEVNGCKSLYLPYTMVRMRLGGVSTGSLSGIIRGNCNVYRAFRSLGVRPKPFYFARRLLPKAWNILRVLFLHSDR